MGEFDIPIIAGAAAIGISLLCVAIWLMTLWWERRRVKQNGIQIEMG